MGAIGEVQMTFLYDENAPKPRHPQKNPVKNRKPRKITAIPWRAHSEGRTFLVAVMIHQEHYKGPLVFRPAEEYAILLMQLATVAPHFHDLALAKSNGNEEKLLYKIYERAHKAWYDNGADRASGNRLTKSPEHYDNDKRLKPHIAEAKRLYRVVLGG
jgi:hypothetical protein